METLNCFMKLLHEDDDDDDDGDDDDDDDDDELFRGIVNQWKTGDFISSCDRYHDFSSSQITKHTKGIKASGWPLEWVVL